MRRCRSCERVSRKLRRAVVLDAGELVSGLVCGRCALRAVAFVVPPATTIAPPCVSCRKRPAAVCSECHGKVCEHVRELTAANVALSVTRAH